MTATRRETTETGSNGVRLDASSTALLLRRGDGRMPVKRMRRKKVETGKKMTRCGYLLGGVAEDGHHCVHVRRSLSP